jgi:hypothetical protein
VTGSHQKSSPVRVWPHRISPDGSGWKAYRIVPGCWSRLWRCHSVSCASCGRSNWRYGLSGRPRPSSPQPAPGPPGPLDLTHGGGIPSEVGMLWDSRTAAYPQRAATKDARVGRRARAPHHVWPWTLRPSAPGPAPTLSSLLGKTRDTAMPRRYPHARPFDLKGGAGDARQARSL